jgi:hypothetical protein
MEFLRSTMASGWGDRPLNLKSYNIGGLTKMLGVLKMHEDILVHVDLTFGSVPTGGTPAPIGITGSSR